MRILGEYAARLLHRKDKKPDKESEKEIAALDNYLPENGGVRGCKIVPREANMLDLPDYGMFRIKVS